MNDSHTGTMTLEARNVTGSATMPVQVQRALPAPAVAQTLANIMALPSDTVYALRDDDSSAYLDDRPIGEQVEPGTRITVTPKTHLG